MQFRLRPYIIYLILNLVHYLIQIYFCHYYVPIIVLSLVGLSACFPCVCSAEILQQGVIKLGKVSGKMEFGQISDRWDNSVLNSVIPFLAYLFRKSVFKAQLWPLFAENLCYCGLLNVAAWSKSAFTFEKMTIGTEWKKLHLLFFSTSVTLKSIHQSQMVGLQPCCRKHLFLLRWLEGQ